MTVSIVSKPRPTLLRNFCVSSRGCFTCRGNSSRWGLASSLYSHGNFAELISNIVACGANNDHHHMSFIAITVLHCQNVTLQREKMFRCVEDMFMRGLRVPAVVEGD